MRKTILLAIAGLAFLPGLAPAASPLRLECIPEESRPGRALVCEYFILGRSNAQLADLHEKIDLAGRAGRIDAQRWLEARDACRDVECLDKVFEGGIEAARGALVDVETRQPTLIVTTARGIPLQLVKKAPVQVASALPPEVLQRPAARAPVGFEPSSFGVVLLLLVAAAVLYTVVVVRISRPGFRT